jgi:hypothetical protein
VPAVVTGSRTVIVTKAGRHRQAPADTRVNAFFARMIRIPMSDLPTARTTVGNGCTVEVWCNGCRRAVAVDLQKLIDDGRGDIPLIELKWRCSGCEGTSFGLIVGSEAEYISWWTMLPNPGIRRSVQPVSRSIVADFPLRMLSMFPKGRHARFDQFVSFRETGPLQRLEFLSFQFVVVLEEPRFLRADEVANYQWSQGGREYVRAWQRPVYDHCESNPRRAHVAWPQGRQRAELSGRNRLALDDP